MKSFIVSTLSSIQWAVIGKVKGQQFRRLST